MMTIHPVLKHIEQPAFSMSLFVPDPAEVQHVYFDLKTGDNNTPFPYWAKLWSASLAMASFLQQHIQYVQGKNVLELAAGLGLPSLLAAQYAASVCCSDYAPEAVAVAMQSATHHGLTNMQCRVLNWHHLPDDIEADVLLLSDVNYDPSEFEVLYRVLRRFIGNGTTVLLATPQRLMAKPFIERLLPWCVQQHELTVYEDGQDTMVSVLVLEKK